MQYEEDTNKAMPYIWDSWCRYDPHQGLFHVYYLNVDDHALVPLDQHHFHAKVGYATTPDFESFSYINHAVLTATDPDASRDNTSIWTGSQIAYGQDNRQLMAFTSRDAARPCPLGKEQPLTQHISFASSHDGINWERLANMHIDADPRFYSAVSIVDDVAVHAWRDPFMFRVPGSDHVYMVVAAHALNRAHGRKGERNGEHGVIALLRTTRPFDLREWEATGISFAVGVAEAEVPRVYYDEATQRHIICYSCKSDEAYISVSEEHPEISYAFYGFSVDFDEILDKIARKGADDHEMVDISERERIALLDFREDALYACQIIPELDGAIVGFDPVLGRLRKSSVRAFPSFTQAPSDFSGIELLTQNPPELIASEEEARAEKQTHEGHGQVHFVMDTQEWSADHARPATLVTEDGQR